MQAAVAVSVREVDHHSYQQPDSEAVPRLFREVLRQEDAGESAQDGEEPGAAGDAEGAFAVRVLHAQDDDADADQQEREQRSDVGQIDHRVERREKRRDPDENAGDDRGYVRRPELRMDAREERRQQTVARYGEEDARLAELEHE